MSYILRKNLTDFFNDSVNLKIQQNTIKKLIVVDRSNFPEIKIEADNGNFINAISFACNDYLGLSVNKQVKAEFIKVARQNAIGSGGSKFIGGYCKYSQILEQKLAKSKNLEACTLFSSGYLANIGVIGSIFCKDDIIFADKQVHASIIDGITLSGARLVRYLHLNHNNLQSLIAKNIGHDFFGKIGIVSESVFSMSGDIDNIATLTNIAKANNALLIIDNAHGFGVLPQTNKINYEHYIEIGTLSKAAGLCGGYACASKIIIEYIKNYARSGIYNTFLPPAVLAALVKSVDIINTTQQTVIQKAKYFVEELNKMFNLKNNDKITANSAIVCINFGKIFATKPVKYSQINKTIAEHQTP